MLFKAVNQRNSSAGQQLMDKLRQKYPSTGAAVWSRVIIARQQMADNNYDEAIKQYRAVISEEGDNTPLYPLLEYGLALACESSRQYNKAIDHYKILQDKPGFVSIACFGLARNQEALGRMAVARENYKKAKSGEGVSSSEKQFIDYKLSTI